MTSGPAPRSGRIRGTATSRAIGPQGSERSQPAVRRRRDWLGTPRRDDPGRADVGPDLAARFAAPTGPGHLAVVIGRDRGQEAALPGPFRFVRRGLSILAMTSTRSFLLALSMGVPLLMVSDALAGPATDQLRTSVDLVLKILSDPELKKEARSLERRRAIRAVANQIFDFGEISRRSLAQHWQARTPAEREEFTRLFGDLLEQSYISKIENYSGEKIQRSEEHTSELQSPCNLVCRLLLEKKKKLIQSATS